MRTVTFIVRAELANGRLVHSLERLVHPVPLKEGVWRGKPQYFHPLARLAKAAIEAKEGIQVLSVEISR